MSGRLIRLFTVSTVLMAAGVAASAEPPAPPPENVTVTATKSREVLDKFVKTLVTPTTLSGKIARWESGVCPVTVGQPPQVAAQITQHVRDIAASVGAPVSSLKSCPPNIEIVFTTTPQALLDNVRKDDPDLLGYATTDEQRVALAKVTRPVQAWYTTETIDLDGRRTIDSGQRPGYGVTMSNYSAFSMPSTSGRQQAPIELPDATFARVSGNRVNDGTHSGFYHVLVAVDSSKLAGRQFGPLADYIAILALAQLNSLDTCQELPSIVNMLATDCDQKIDGMTSTDLAYLHGLYSMGSDKSLVFQQNDIADTMTAALSKADVAAAPAPDLPPTRCDAPDQPSAIDSAAITLDQLNTSIRAAKQFMAASDAYQDCLGKEIQAQTAAATSGKAFVKAIADRDMALVAANQKIKETVGASVNGAITTYNKAHPAP